MQRIRPQGQEATGQQLWASNDGGATWAKLGPEMAATQFGGGMHILRHHPTDDTLLLGGQNGLWKSNTAKTSWSRPFNAGGLPTTRCTALEIDPANGNHMYAFMFDGAVWRTTNGGSSWVDSYSAVEVKRGCVDWRSPEPVVFVQLNRSVSAGFTLVRSTGPGGTDYQPPRSITGGFGWRSNDAYHNVALSKKTTAPGFEAIITPAAGVCLINASARMKRSEDGGATFQDTSIGFTGVGFVAYTPSVVVQRADNPDCIAIPVQDTNLLVSTDGFRSVDVRQIHIDPTVFGFPPSGVRSSYCLEWLPADAQNPDGVILIGLGNANRQGVCRSTDIGLTWTAITSAAGASLRHIRRHPTLDAIVAGERISIDRGLTFPVAINGTAIGVSRNGTLYVMRAGNTEIWRSTDWAQRAIAGQAPSFTQFYQGPKFEKYSYLGSLARVSLAEENTVWCEGAGKDLVRVRNSGTTFGAAVSTPFGLKGQKGAQASDALFELADICPDPKLPEVVFVTAFVTGGQHIWRGTVAGDQVSWEDYTGNAPKWQDTSIQVLEDSGDILVGGGVGGWLRQRPAGWPATRASRFPQLAQPVLRRRHDQPGNGRRGFTGRRRPLSGRRHYTRPGVNCSSWALQC